MRKIAEDDHFAVTSVGAGGRAMEQMVIEYHLQNGKKHRETARQRNRDRKIDTQTHRHTQEHHRERVIANCSASAQPYRITRFEMYLNRTLQICSVHPHIPLAGLGIVDAWMEKKALVAAGHQSSRCTR